MFQKFAQDKEGKYWGDDLSQRHIKDQGFKEQLPQAHMLLYIVFQQAQAQ